MTTTAALSTLFLLVARSFAQAPDTLAKPLPNDPLQVTIHRLSNGMTVYLSPNHQDPRIASAVAVRAGSRNDPRDSTGMAHYLEHMLFKGSANLGTLDYAKEKAHLDRILALYERHFQTKDPKEAESVYKEIDKESIEAGKYAVPNELDKAYNQMGFTGVNAGTNYDATTYVSEFPRNRAATWAAVEADRYARPVFRLFQSEIETVYEEKNMEQDNREWILGNAVREKLYKGHPYTVPIIGTIEHLKKPSLAKMYAFFDRYYVPNNMAIALSGDFDRDEMLKLLESTFGTLKRKDLPPLEKPRPEPVKGVERVDVKYEGEEKVEIAWPTVPKGHPDEDALSIMDMLMDNSAAGLINLDLEQAQKVKDAGSHPEDLNEAGAWYVWAVTKQGQTLEQAETLLLETVAKLKAGAFTEDDIRAVVTDFEVNRKKGLEANMRRADTMADSFTAYEPWEKTSGRIERLKTVTKDDVLRVARQYLGENRVVATRRNAKPDLPSIKKPNFTTVEIDPSRQSAFFKKIIAMPAEPIEPKWLVPGRDYAVTPMPQGNLYSTRNPFNDLFALTFTFDLGSDHEREICAALDLVELSGAGALTAEEFKKKLYGLGTTLGYGCDRESLTVSVSGLDANLWPSLEMMAERFESPSIAQDTLPGMIAVQLGAHQDNKKNPEYVHHALAEFASRGQDSSVLAELSDKELRGLQEDRLKRLLKGLFGYRHRTAFVGNRSPGEMVKLLGLEAGKLKEPPARKPLRYVRPAKPRVLLTHRDMLQSWVGVFSADEVFNPDHVVDYRFYTGYMGGGMSGVIWQEVREARSLGYYADGGYEEADYKGDDNALVANVGTQADKTGEATSVLLGLLRQFPASAERFGEVRKSQEQLYRTKRINFRAVPGTIVLWERLGFAGDPRPARFEKTLAYTLPQTEAFSRRFKAAPLTVHILGNKSRMDLDALRKLGDFEEKPLDQLFPY